MFRVECLVSFSLNAQLFCKGYFRLVFPFALHELRVALGAVTLREVDTVLLFGCGRFVRTAIRAGLDDVHHRTVLIRVPADIIRIVTHQYPPHRIYAYVKLYLSHVVFGNGRALAERSALIGAPHASTLRSANASLVCIPRKKRIPPCRRRDYFGNLCPSIILTQGDNFESLLSAFY